MIKTLAVWAILFFVSYVGFGVWDDLTSKEKFNAVKATFYSMAVASFVTVLLAIIVVLF